MVNYNLKNCNNVLRCEHDFASPEKRNFSNRAVVTKKIIIKIRL